MYYDRTSEKLLNGEPDMNVQKNDAEMEVIEASLKDRYIGAMSADDNFDEQLVRRLNAAWEFGEDTATLSGYAWLIDELPDQPLPKSFVGPVEQHPDQGVKYLLKGARMISRGVTVKFTQQQGEPISDVRLAYDFSLVTRDNDEIDFIAYREDLTQHRYDRLSVTEAKHRLENQWASEFNHIEAAFADGIQENFHEGLAYALYLVEDALKDEAFREALKLYLFDRLNRTGPYDILVVAKLGLASADLSHNDEDSDPTTVKIDGAIRETLFYPMFNFEKNNDGAYTLQVVGERRSDEGDEETELLYIDWENLRRFKSLRGVGTLGMQALKIGRLQGLAFEEPIEELSHEHANIEIDQINTEPPAIESMKVFQGGLMQIIETVERRSKLHYDDGQQAYRVCQDMVKDTLTPILESTGLHNQFHVSAEGETIVVPNSSVYEEDVDGEMRTIVKTSDDEPVTQLMLGESWVGKVLRIVPEISVVDPEDLESQRLYKVSPKLRLTKTPVVIDRHSAGHFIEQYFQLADVPLDGSAAITVDGLQRYLEMAESLKTIKKTYGEPMYEVTLYFKDLMSDEDPHRLLPIKDVEVFHALAEAHTNAPESDGRHALHTYLDRSLLDRTVTIAGRHMRLEGNNLEPIGKPQQSAAITGKVVDVRSDLGEDVGLCFVVEYNHEEAKALAYIPFRSIVSFNF